jgi:hypothetical protein
MPVDARGLPRILENRGTAMILNYVALAILLVAVVLVFYTFIYIHDIPYEIAKHRNHPQKDVIHVGCWLSLFTLHAIWPFVFMWAVSNPKSVELKVSDHEMLRDHDEDERLDKLETRLKLIEKAILAEKGVQQ